MSKRIALISEHASPLGILGTVDSGGQNVYVAQIAKNLAAGGYQVDVFTRRDSPDLPDITKWVNGVRIFHVPAGPPGFVPKEAMLPYMRAFTEFVRQCASAMVRTYDLLHANFWMSGLVAADIKRALGIPFVITFHALGRVRRMYQGKDDLFPDERFEIEDRIIAEADHIIAECPQDEEDMIRLYNADPARITIIPCGFDPVELWPVGKSAARMHLGLEPDERTILQLGRMVPRKGVDLAIRGFARLLKKHDLAARLLIVGGESAEPDPRVTPEIGRLQNVAREERVAERVTFVGHRGRDVLRYYYSAADMFVTTPWYEPFGITPVEAMACGTPIIGTRVGGIKFTVRDAETGYLVPPNDPDAIADRMADLYKHPRLLDVLSRQSIRRANDLFTWPRVSSAVAALYDEVLSANHPKLRRGTNKFAVIDRAFEQAIEVMTESGRRLRTVVMEAAETLSSGLRQGGKLLICGNGGGAAFAQHFAAEFIGRLKRDDRPGLPALSLNSETAFLTGWSNEINYDTVFERQVEAFGQPGDVLLGIDTLGRSQNVVNAFGMARRLGLRCIALTGGAGGELSNLADLSIVIPSSDVQRIQEVQIVILHQLCELVEERFIFSRQLQEVAATPKVYKMPPRRVKDAAARSSRIQEAKI